VKGISLAEVAAGFTAAGESGSRLYVSADRFSCARQIWLAQAKLHWRGRPQVTGPWVRAPAMLVVGLVNWRAPPSATSLITGTRVGPVGSARHVGRSLTRAPGLPNRTVNPCAGIEADRAAPLLPTSWNLQLGPRAVEQFDQGRAQL
jgi:hypothetical protein